MHDVETEIEPPGLPTEDDDEGWEGTAVHVALFEMDGTRRRRAGYAGLTSSHPLKGRDSNYAAEEAGS